MKKLILASLGIMSLLLFNGCSSDKNDGNDPSLMSVTNSGTLSILEKTSFDWGDINIEGGDVEHVFRLKNAGEEDLIIKSANTTCMCTTAFVETKDGLKSPAFGMHGTVEWGQPIKPGEAFDVRVVFDPMAHGPTATGPIQRSVFLFTSSKPNAEFAEQLPQSAPDAVTELKVSGNVLLKGDYEKKASDLAFIFNETEHDFGIVKQSQGIISYDFEFEYQGAEPITVTAVPTSCACTSAKISQKEFSTGDTGVLTVEFDPNLHAEPEGKFFKTVTLLTEPPLEEQPEVKIWVEMDLDLGPEAYKLKEPHDDEAHVELTQ